MDANLTELVLLGGGHGQSSVVAGVCGLPNVRVTSICPNSDNGKSTGRCRSEAKVNGWEDPGGFIGDAGECAASMISDSTLAFKLRYRYENGSLMGHSRKNALLKILCELGGPEWAMKQFFTLFGISPHRVLPVSDQPSNLVARLANKTDIFGESQIDDLATLRFFDPHKHRIKEVWLKPMVTISPAVREAIEQAKVIGICPGSWYTSIWPVLVADGMKKVINRSAAKIVLLINLVTQMGDTPGYRARDFLQQIEKYIDRPVDIILMNNNTNVPLVGMLEEQLSGRKVNVRLVKPLKDKRVRLAPFLMEVGDTLRHNPEVIRTVFEEIIAEL